MAVAVAGPVLLLTARLPKKREEESSGRLSSGVWFNMAELDTRPREEELSDSVTRAPGC